ncbi:MAG: hypothetical protein AB1564_04585 [Chloroflexota bacterium]
MTNTRNTVLPRKKKIVYPLPPNGVKNTRKRTINRATPDLRVGYSPSYALTDSSQLTLYTKIYELYLQRIMKEGDWYWTRFNIFMTLNIGALAALGFVFKDHLVDIASIPISMWLATAGIATVGFQLSKAWKAISVNGRFWQATMTSELAQIESILNQAHVDLFSRIDNIDKETRNKKVDVVDTSTKVANFFSIIWLAILLISVILIATFATSVI